MMLKQGLGLFVSNSKFERVHCFQDMSSPENIARMLYEFDYEMTSDEKLWPVGTKASQKYDETKITASSFVGSQLGRLVGVLWST